MFLRGTEGNFMAILVVAPPETVSKASPCNPHTPTCPIISPAPTRRMRVLTTKPANGRGGLLPHALVSGWSGETQDRSHACCPAQSARTAVDSHQLLANVWSRPFWNVGASPRQRSWVFDVVRRPHSMGLPGKASLQRWSLAHGENNEQELNTEIKGLWRTLRAGGRAHARAGASEGTCGVPGTGRRRRRDEERGLHSRRWGQSLALQRFWAGGFGQVIYPLRLSFLPCQMGMIGPTSQGDWEWHGLPCWLALSEDSIQGHRGDGVVGNFVLWTERSSLGWGKEFRAGSQEKHEENWRITSTKPSHNSTVYEAKL